MSISKKLAKVLDSDLYLDPHYKNGCEFVLQLKVKRISLPVKKSTYEFRRNKRKGIRLTTEYGSIFEMPDEHLDSIEREMLEELSDDEQENGIDS